MTAPTINDSFKKGDLEVRFRHMDCGDGGGEQPCMLVLHATHKELNGNRPCIAIPLNSAFQFVESGDLMIRVHRYAEILYPGFATKQDRYRIADIIIECLGDLTQMPPPPAMTRQQWYDKLEKHGVSIKLDGKQVFAA